MAAPNLIAYTALPAPTRRDSRVRAGLGWAVRAVNWMVAGCILVGGVGYGLSAQTNGIVACLGVIALVLLMVCAATLARGVRRVRDASTLLYLEQAVRLNAPLGQLLAAAERSERPAVRHRLRRLRMMLEAGAPVAASLASAAPQLSRRVVGVVAAGESAGRLASGLRRVVERREFTSSIAPLHAIYFRWYPLLLWSTVLAILQFSLFYVLPKYGVILHDLGSSLAYSSVAKSETTFSIAAVLCSATVGGLLIFLARTLSQIFTPTGVTLGPLRRPVDVIRWHMPVIGSVVRNGAIADACHALADACQARWVMSRAIASTADACSNWVLERRLRRWARETLTGLEIGAAAGKAGMPRLLVDLLSSVSDDGERENVLRFVCQYCDDHAVRRAALLQRIGIVLITFAGGAIVLAMALGLLQPLVACMNRLMDHAFIMSPAKSALKR